MLWEDASSQSDAGQAGVVHYWRPTKVPLDFEGEPTGLEKNITSRLHGFHDPLERNADRYE
jgi:hypothetical protein